MGAFVKFLITIMLKLQIFKHKYKVRILIDTLYVPQYWLSKKIESYSQHY